MNENLNRHQQNLITALCNISEASKQSLAEKAIAETLILNELEELCSLISNEYMLNGITENFEPNDYGRELEDLLDIVNRRRLK
ncbi:hypothetical protein CH64_3325 [Yersinia rohdei]|uniref:Uncharacterized protein n=1 Tax=Yersinia rohdei TaxID=29485 RepID=A0ABM5S7Z0_YERRO|nr:hypothetical protein [Yersinia rohdei]AJJ09332.1 hypothetical protein CH64_3325 [Yersinia rohdei]CNF49172.1 Uncharacterised protein [Yersinia rohdei]CQJ50517.1 Uncharacterised protein [Yersinia rohdei]